MLINPWEDRVFRLKHILLLINSLSTIAIGSLYPLLGYFSAKMILLFSDMLQFGAHFSSYFPLKVTQRMRMKVSFVMVGLKVKVHSGLVSLVGGRKEASCLRKGSRLRKRHLEQMYLGEERMEGGTQEECW